MKAIRDVIITWFVPEGWRAKIWRIMGCPVWHPDYCLASVWIRGYQVARYLRQFGYRTLCNELKPRPHVAVFLRRYSEEDAALAKNLRQQGVKIVVDVVVNYFREYQRGNKTGVGNDSKTVVEAFRRIIDTADQIWCVSPFLRDAASNYHYNVHFVPDSVDPEHFNPTAWRKQREGMQPVFGWAGYAVKAGVLSVLRPWIVSEQARLLVISDKPPTLDFPYEFRQWRYSTFPRDISECDLCVAPREVQDDYDRGHSFFKIGVFMAMGVPALAGPVPSYYLLLGDGKGGAICQTMDDWKYHLERFLADSELRSKWRLGARQAMHPYLTPYVAEQIDSLIKRLLG